MPAGRFASGFPTSPSLGSRTATWRRRHGHWCLSEVPWLLPSRRMAGGLRVTLPTRSPHPLAGIPRGSGRPAPGGRRRAGWATCSSWARASPVRMRSGKEMRQPRGSGHLRSMAERKRAARDSSPSKGYHARNERDGATCPDAPGQKIVRHPSGGHSDLGASRFGVAPGTFRGCRVVPGVRSLPPRKT